MIELSRFQQFSGLEVVEKVIYLTRTQSDVSSDFLRIEAVHNGQGKYSTRVSRLADVILQPSDIEDGEAVPERHESVWVAVDAPWTDRPSADEAIMQLLSLMDL